MHPIVSHVYSESQDYSASTTQEALSNRRVQVRQSSTMDYFCNVVQIILDSGAEINMIKAFLPNTLVQ